MKISQNKLRQLARSPQTYRRGESYYQQHKVERMKIHDTLYDKGRVEVDFVVRGTEDYAVYFAVDEKGEIQDQDCTCPAYESSPYNICKHIIAAALQYNKEISETEKSLREEQPAILPPYWEREDAEEDLAENQMDWGKKNDWNFKPQEDMEEGAKASKEEYAASEKNQGDKKVTDKAIYSLMQEALRGDFQSLQETTGEIVLQPLMKLGTEDPARLELKIGSGRMYVVPSVRKLLAAVENGRTERYGKHLTFVHHMENFDEKSQSLLRILRKEYLEQAILKSGNAYGAWGYASYYSRGGLFSDREIPLSAAALDELVHLYEEEGLEIKPIFRDNWDKTSENPTLCRIKEGLPPLQFFVEKEDAGNFIFGCRSHPFLLGAGGRRSYYWLWEDRLYRCQNAVREKVENLLQAMERAPDSVLHIDHRDMRNFIALSMEELEKTVPVEMDPVHREEYAPYRLDSGIYLDVDEEGVVRGKVTFLYGEHQVNPMEASDKAGVRNLKKEIPIMRVINRYLPVFDREESVFKAEGDDKIIALLEEGIQALEEVTVVYGTEAFRRLILHQPPRPGVRISVGRGILDIELSLEGFSLEQLMEALQAYKIGKRYMRLSSGQFLKLDSEEMDELNQLAQDLELEEKPKGKKSGTEGFHRLELPLPRALFLRESLKAHKHLKLEESREFCTLTQTIASAQSSTLTIPKQVEGVLRHYQREGAQWLYALSRCEMGGILADDMGLGKTLQVITLLLSYYEGENWPKEKPKSEELSFQARDPELSSAEFDEKAASSKTVIQTSGALLEEGSLRSGEERRKPSFVVCPTSLVLNWEQEIQKFAPGLKTLLITGKASLRQEKISQIKEDQVVITSYDSLRRDARHYEGLCFAFHILDEAQYIKNQFTKNARSVKEIQSHHRFALTGTPMENYICELWSIFDFLMPGYLYSHRKFQEKFEGPIEKKQDAQVLEKLRKLVGPFVLRRMKREVLRELPEKTETTHYVEMEEEQAKLYKSNAALLHKQLRAQLEEQGLAKSKILVLAMITRLRQICCHPALCFEGYAGGSAKMEAALELIDNAVENGHKLLIFSQFTSMLGLLEEELKDRKIGYYLLTGSTPIAKRCQMVNDFNRDATPAFLISLKAGGTGLNLTGADIVLHLDPWWNISAQNQATDRAHRIGQTNKVQVYKLIVKGTIEEKIRQLQEHKANLADALLEGESRSFTEMNAEDILALFQE